MAVEFETPVSAIEGIGPATAAAFEAISVYTVFDLLRASVDRLHEPVKALASREQVRAWRAMAGLLQVAEVNAQTAEALVGGGVTTVESLYRKDLSQIDSMLRSALADGLIPAVPSSDQIGRMIGDAALLHSTGVITGTVRHGDHTPVRGAEVHVGWAHQQTDARGRFRILRIPLGRKLTLRIEHADYVTRTIESPPISDDIERIAGHIFLMEAKASSTGPAPPTAVRLSELNGDELPFAEVQMVKTEDLDLAALRPRDVLEVTEFYRASPDARLTSRLRSYEDKSLIIHTLRAPVAELQSGVAKGDHYRVRDGALVPVKADENWLRRYRIRLRLRKAFAGRSLPATDQEIEQWRSERYQFLKDNSYFPRR